MRRTMPENKRPIYFDARWIGDHGIGRFATMLDHYLSLPHLPITGNPAAPTDPWRLLRTMLKLPTHGGVLNPGYNAPLRVVRPYIFTICDLNHIDRPENSSLLKKIYYYLIMRPAIHQAFRILTISEYSRERIISWSGVDPSRVVNVGCGVNATYQPEGEPHAPGYPYLLCVSNRRAHKNESRLLEAFAQVEIDADIRLLFTGPPTPVILDICLRLGVSDRVVFLGRIPEGELPALYRGALALLFPSLYEGFGLPVIEAMACGTPVLTSNTTSLPEVAGDAALLVDPLSVSQIARGIEQLCGDETLRQDLRRKGLIQAARFSWENVAARVKAVLNELQVAQGEP